MNSEATREIEVRDVRFKLHVFNRSLDLCSRMNYETENLDFIDSLPEDAVMYDLGACEGRFSIYAAMQGVRVFAFEPDRNNYNVLVENTGINNLAGKISTFNVGVGETEKKAVLQIGQPWAGGHQKVVKHDEVRSDLQFDFVEESSIDVVSLDNFIATHSVPIPYAIKIDIDGSEMPFLIGAAKTLNDSQLKKIIFELDKADKNFSHIISLLEKAGFNIESEYQVPDEPSLFNIIFSKRKI